MPSPLDLQLGRWPVTIEMPVQWGDMDALGHVNNLVYLRWCESARISYFEAGGLWSRRHEGIGPILASTRLDYKLALTYPDSIRAATTVLKLGRTSITMGMRIRSKKHERAIVAEGEAILVMVNYTTGEKHDLGDDLRRRIVDLEARAPQPGEFVADA
jgi:acyl-CoA thioester hydrolase